MAEETQARGHGEKYSRKSDEAIKALLEYGTVAKAAAACGVSERTLSRWQLLDDFKERFRAAQREIVNDAIRLLQSSTVYAVKTLRRNLGCENPFASNAAANSILTHSLKAIEIEELSERIRVLEENQAARGTKQQGR